MIIRFRNLRKIVAIILGAAFLGLAGCSDGVDESVMARAEQDCFEHSKNAEYYEECRQMSEDWLRNPEENPEPPFLAKP